MLLAGRRRTIVKTLIQKKNTERWSSRRYTWIERRRLKRTKKRDRRCPQRGVAIHVLPYRLRIPGLHGNPVRDRQPESSSRQAPNQRTHNHADQHPAPPRLPGHRNACNFWLFHSTYNNLDDHTPKRVPSKITGGCLDPMEVTFPRRPSSNPRHCKHMPRTLADRLLCDRSLHKCAKLLASKTPLLRAWLGIKPHPPATAPLCLTASDIPESSRKPPFDDVLRDQRIACQTASGGTLRHSPARLVWHTSCSMHPCLAERNLL